jgi:hypothetical protein
MTFWRERAFISIDYDFGRSSAAAYMHVCLRDGRIVTIAEIVEKHMPVYEFGSEMIRRFDLRGTQGERRNILVVYQDPANKSHVGTGHSVRDQLNDVLAECDLGAIDGSNDRIGGWLSMYEMLAADAGSSRTRAPCSLAPSPAVSMIRRGRGTCSR